METKSNTGLVVIVTLLVVAVAGLIGFIAYDKVLKEETPVNSGNNNVQQSENNTNKEHGIDIEKIKEGVSKVISFTKLNEDLSYLKLTKSGNLSIGIKEDSSLYNKYSKEKSIASDVLDVYIFDIGNAGYQYIYALKEDGTIDRMEIPYPASYSDFKWEKNYKNLKNIIYLDLYSKETPRLVNDQGETFEVYDQTISAVDVEGNVYSLDQATESVYAKK